MLRYLATALPVHKQICAPGRDHSGEVDFSVPRAVYLLLYLSAMPTPGASPKTEPKVARDIVFACAHCAASFVVDAAAAGVTLACQNCNKQTTVPHPSVEAAAGEALRISELQHQLKENDSQRTEITGYINQHSIQLHRWQLRLKTLQERQVKLEAELAQVCRDR